MCKIPETKTIGLKTVGSTAPIIAMADHALEENNLDELLKNYIYQPVVDALFNVKCKVVVANKAHDLQEMWKNEL